MKTLIFTLLFSIALTTGFAQVFNVKQGVWSDPAVWSTNTLPADASDVILNYDLVIDINISVNSLNTNGHNVTVNNGVQVNVLGNNALVFDIEGHAYNTVKIGSQVWLQKNLNVAHYRNGDPIPQGSINEISSAGYWYYYNYDAANGPIYGKLYNRNAIIDPRGLAPHGWHVPADSEWVTLIDYLGGIPLAGGKMKEAGLSHWKSPNIGADNSSGFTAVPGGIGVGGFVWKGSEAAWWSTSLYMDDVSKCWGINIFNDGRAAYRNYFSQNEGYSVRCVKDNGLPVIATTGMSSVTKSSAISGGNITDSGSSSITSRGVCWNKNIDPTINDNKTNDGTGTGIFISTITGLDSNTVYYVRAYAINSLGISYGKQYSFTTSSVVTIGIQNWMTKNLDVSTYKNGDTIPEVQDTEEWANLTTGAWCYYNNDTTGSHVYGKLYNFYAVTDPRGLAPSGWHVPADTEWVRLVDYLGGSSVAGGKLKEGGTSHWLSPNTGADNSSGFSAVGASSRDTTGEFYPLGYYGRWWSLERNVLAVSRYDAETFQFYALPKNGYSVRCIPVIKKSLICRRYSGNLYNTAPAL